MKFFLARHTKQLSLVVNPLDITFDNQSTQSGEVRVDVSVFLFFEMVKLFLECTNWHTHVSFNLLKGSQNSLKIYFVYQGFPTLIFGAPLNNYYTIIYQHTIWHPNFHKKALKHTSMLILADHLKASRVPKVENHCCTYTVEINNDNLFY